MQRVSAPMAFEEMDTPDWGTQFLMCGASLLQGFLCQETGGPHQCPWWWCCPTFTQNSSCPDLWRTQTTCPVLAAIVGEMAQHSCFKCYSFLEKSYGASPCLLQWWLWPLSTQHPPRGPCRHVGTQGAGVTSRTCSLLFGRISPISTLQAADISLNKHTLTRKLQPIPAQNWATLTSGWSNVSWCSVIHLSASHLFLWHNLRRWISL